MNSLLFVFAFTYALHGDCHETFGVNECNAILQTVVQGGQPISKTGTIPNHTRVGKAGPKGDKGDPAEVCQCLSDSDLVQRMESLEGKG